MRYSNHGAGCCGIRHLSQFSVHDGRNYIELRNAPPSQVAYEARTIPGLLLEGKLTEAVINQRQVEAGWAKLLEHLGFRLVTRFKNNGGSMCYVYHWCTSVRCESTKWTRYMPLLKARFPSRADMRKRINSTNWSTFFSDKATK